MSLAVSLAPSVRLSGHSFCQGLEITRSGETVTVAIPACVQPNHPAFRCKADPGGYVSIVFATIAADNVAPYPEAPAADEYLSFTVLPCLRAATVIYESMESTDSVEGGLMPTRGRTPSSGSASGTALRTSSPVDSQMSVHTLQTLVAELRDQRLEMVQLHALMGAGASMPAGAPAVGSTPNLATRTEGRPAAPNPWDAVLPPTREQRRATAGDPLDEEEEEEDDDGTWSFAPRQQRSGTGVAKASAPAPLQAARPPMDVNAAIQLEMLKTLQQLRKKGNGDSDSEGEEGPRKVSGLRDVERLRRRVFSQPAKVFGEYVTSVREKLCVSGDQQLWSFRDYTKKQSGKFGRFKGMLRIHYMISEILTRCHGSDFKVATAMLVQLHKVVFQVALDFNDWSTAVLLWPQSDPLGAEEYAGNADEMMAAQRWKKAMVDLKGKVVKPSGRTSEDEGEDEKGDKQQRRPRGKGAKGAGRAAPAEK